MTVLTFSDLIKKPVFIILLAAIIIILVAAVILVYFFFIKRKHQEKSVIDLEKKYQDLHRKLVEDVAQSVARVEKIAELNPDYLAKSDAYKNMLSEILTKNDRASYSALSGLKKNLNSKDYKELPNLTSATRSTITEFERRVSVLEGQLNEELSSEEDFHQRVNSIQRKYRGLKELRSNKESELRIISDSFNKLFGRIDRLFEQTNRLVAGAHYKEANEKLPVIEAVLDEIEKAFDKLPEYCVKIDQVIPKKMEEVQQKYNELEEKEYPLHHLKVMSTLDGFRTQLDDITKRVSTFNLKDVGTDLDEIDNTIMEIFKSFADEEAAKVYFDENCDSMYNATYELEKQFKKIKRALPNYKEVYRIKDKYLDKVEELEQDINNIQTIKRDLDNYIHSNTKQPYSIIVSKLHDMENEMKRIDEIIRDFNVYLLSLKSDSEKAYHAICDYYLKLKDAEYTLREMAVPYYSEHLRIGFERAYSSLEQIGEIIKVRPIDVASADEILTSAEELIEGLLKDIKEQSGQCKYAEESIVYANQYRQGFIEAKYSLNNAGSAFFEGDFTRTLDATYAILKKMKPDMNQ